MVKLVVLKSQYRAEIQQNQDAAVQQALQNQSVEFQSILDLTNKHHNDEKALLRKERQKDAEEFHQFQKNSMNKNRSLEAEIDRIKQKAQRDLFDLQSLLEQERKRLTGDIQVMAGHHRRQLDDLEARMVQMELEFERQKAEMEKLHGQEINHLNEEWALQDSLLRKDHQRREEGFRKEIESLNDALNTRDRFTPITDHKLKSLFIDLSHEIDMVAGREWEANRTEYSDALIQQLSTNQRRLKKQIIQDKVWKVLYENIFCSPFRIFGSRGRALEAEWADGYGKDVGASNDYFAWPPATASAERWRWEVLMEGQSALENVVSEYDSRAHLKRGFIKSRNKVRKALTEVFEKISSSIDQDTLLNIENITTKAATMWVVFGTQRCRILVVIPEPAMHPMSEGEDDGGNPALYLVSALQLRRVGNSKGEYLDKEEIIGGCEGAVVSLPAK